MSVEGPSKAEIQCVENADGTCSVSYLPLAPGQYTITIKFADEHIPGSPFIAKITGKPINNETDDLILIVVCPVIFLRTVYCNSCVLNVCT